MCLWLFVCVRMGVYIIRVAWGASERVPIYVFDSAYLYMLLDICVLLSVYVFVTMCIYV